jgi:hypothetical protein
MCVALMYLAAKIGRTGSRSEMRLASLISKEKLMTDQEKAKQRDFSRKVRDLIAQLHDMGGTKVGGTQFASRELAYAEKDLRTAEHWVRDHFFTNHTLKDMQNGDRNGKK